MVSSESMIPQEPVKATSSWEGAITSANHSLVKDGWCWWYRKYAPGDTVLEGLEKEAREARKGLWVDPQPVPPWECGIEHGSVG